MKRIFAVAFAVISLLSCNRQQMDRCDLPINGMWAEVDQLGWCSSYLLFEDGHCYRYISEGTYYAGSSAMWECSEDDFKYDSQTRYSVVDGEMMYDYPDSRAAGQVSIKDSVMTIGKDRYVAVLGFNKGKYSQIMLDSFQFLYPQEQEVVWDIPIKNPVPGLSITATTNNYFIQDLRTEGTKVYFKASQLLTNSRYGKITLSYPTADDVEIQVVQGQEPVISVQQSVYEYTSAESNCSIPLSIQNFISEAEFTVTSDASWIKEIDVSYDWVWNVHSAKFSLEENTQRSPRSGTITISYPYAKDVLVTINQEGSLKMSFSPEMGEVSYYAGNYSFKCTVSEPDITIKAESMDPWITVVSVIGKQVTYRVDTPKLWEPRTGQIKVTCDVLEKNYTVYQYWY